MEKGTKKVFSSVQFPRRNGGGTGGGWLGRQYHSPDWQGSPHLEDEGLLSVELGDLEAVVPLLLPAEDATTQQQRLP